MVRDIAASWAQKIIGPLVVAAILGVAGGGVVLRDAVVALRSEVAYLKDEAENGERYTALRISRSEATISNHEERLDDHAGMQEHEGADRRMREHDRQINSIEINLAEYWRALAEAMKQIHDHTKGTSGRVGRIDTLEKRMDRIDSNRK